jgi:peptide/nickel transport system substrate-binding protein
VGKVVLAATDRERLGRARGLDQQVATHFLPPGVPGFDEAGGVAGPGFDFLANPRGDLRLARAYLRRAGHRGGRFRGAPVTMVADNADPDREIARLFARMLRGLGFRVRARYVNRATMFIRYCNRPRARVDICPSVGWLKDFHDAQTVLDPTFRGDNIISRNNSNWSQLAVPSIDRAMRAAIRLPPGPDRARAWGAIDRQVTAQAPAVPLVWDTDASVASADVEGAMNESTGIWDLSFTGVRG